MPVSFPTTSIQSIFELLEQPLLRVRGSLKAIASPDSAALAETVKHSLSSGGKYLRPAMTLLCGAATAPLSNITVERYPDALVESAAVTEMIHVATLLHDDVIDQSDLRRGKQTARALWGDKISILGGDYLLAQASVKLAALGMPRLVSIFAWVLADLCSGEVEQMQASYPSHEAWDSKTSRIQWDSYYRKTVCKTGSLFSAGCESAGVVNALPEEQIQALKSYGRHLGIAFQIMDDLLDYTSTEEELGKPVLGDLRDGLMNAPVLLALESDRLEESSRKALRASIDALFKTPETAPIQPIYDLLQECDALNATRELALSHVRQACEAIEFIPASAERDALLAVAEFVVTRQS